MNRNPGQGIAPAEIIQTIAAKEAISKHARDNYTCTQDVSVQTLNGRTVDGEYRQVTDITYDDKGNRIETVTFAPQSTLTRVQMTPEDFDDIRNSVAARPTTL